MTSTRIGSGSEEAAGAGTKCHLRVHRPCGVRRGYVHPAHHARGPLALLRGATAEAKPPSQYASSSISMATQPGLRPTIGAYSKVVGSFSTPVAARPSMGEPWVVRYSAGVKRRRAPHLYLLYLSDSLVRYARTRTS